MFFLSPIDIFGQKKSPTYSIGQIKEFTGKVIFCYQYDGDYYFSLEDSKNIETKFHFIAGSCHTEGDPYSIDCEIDQELKDKFNFFTADSVSDIKVKVTAKYSYGLFCGNNGKKSIGKIWRPIKIIQTNKP